MKQLRAVHCHAGRIGIRKAGPKRAWMDHSKGYRCLPMVMANQLGWELLLPETVMAYWDGGEKASNTHILAGPKWGCSHFGHGILTFHIWSLMRTPENVNLMVTGPVNWPMAHVSPLEGIIETDWSPMSFTMNWQFTEVNKVVAFYKGQPIARVVPIPRGFVEDFDLEEMEYHQMPEEERLAYENWRDRRREFLDTETDTNKWMRDYMRGAAQKPKSCPHSLVQTAGSDSTATS